MSSDVVSEAIASYPGFAAVVVLVLGAALALIGRHVAARAAGSVDRVFGRRPDGMSPVIVRNASLFVFWTVMILTVVVSLRVLGIDALSNWLDNILDFLPQFFAGLVIIGVGHVVGIALRDVVRRLNQVHEIAMLDPSWAYAAVLGVALITGVQQMGVNVAFVAQLALITFTIVAGAIGLAFALGARQHVANLIARTELAGYSAGERVRIDGIEGVVVEIARTKLVLATDDGLVHVPAARFSTQVATRLAQSDD